ncbi:DNA gyrase inhibitor YacG [Candidatus Methylocalor cossyra]|uniref:DNA gyrase inhibitor YacG n=1 Tax=Candidatus Methylocalor cossyra TaxID=3108543 RepID=A0ABM9NEZ8_9GAMM
MPVVVKCPQCGKAVPWRESEKYRPFCSERCQLIDLGHWASGSYAIPDQDELPEPRGVAADTHGDGGD